MSAEKQYRFDFQTKWIFSNLDDFVLKVFATDPEAIGVQFVGTDDYVPAVFFFDRGTDEKVIRQDCAEKVAHITVIGYRLVVSKDGEDWACEAKPLNFLHPNHKDWVEAEFARYDAKAEPFEWPPVPASASSPTAGGTEIEPDLSFFEIMLSDGATRVDMLFEDSRDGERGFGLIRFDPDSDLEDVASRYVAMLDSGAQPRAYRSVMADGTERATLFPWIAPRDRTIAENSALRIIREVDTYRAKE